MVGILCMSITSAAIMGLLMKFVDGKGSSPEQGGGVMDRAARREMRGQRGFGWRKVKKVDSLGK